MPYGVGASVRANRRGPPHASTASLWLSCLRASFVEGQTRLFIVRPMHSSPESTYTIFSPRRDESALDLEASVMIYETSCICLSGLVPNLDSKLRTILDDGLSIA